MFFCVERYKYEVAVNIENCNKRKSCECHENISPENYQNQLKYYFFKKIINFKVCNKNGLATKYVPFKLDKLIKFAYMETKFYLPNT